MYIINMYILITLFTLSVNIKKSHYDNSVGTILLTHYTYMYNLTRLEFIITMLCTFGKVSLLCYATGNRLKILKVCVLHFTFSFSPTLSISLSLYLSFPHSPSISLFLSHSLHFSLSFFFTSTSNF